MRTGLIALLVCAPLPGLAQRLIDRLEQAATAIDEAMGAGSVEWSPQMRSARSCGLSLLGPDRAERYVQAVEAAVPEARDLQTAGAFGGLWSRVHRAAGLSRADLIRAAGTCGIGY